jgi:hypothetical protein
MASVGFWRSGSRRALAPDLEDLEMSNSELITLEDGTFVRDYSSTIIQSVYID